MPGLEDAATIALDKLISIVAEQIYDEAPVSTGSGSDFTYGFDELPKEYAELKSGILAEARSRIAAACLL
jgi:hypothetical protein